MIAVDRLPREIRESTRAVVWRFVPVPGRKKPTKVPFRARRPDLAADSTDPRTWASFAEALAAVAAGKAHGAGIALGDGLAGVDLDECRDPDTGAIASEALAIVQELDSYTELSPSGTGLHVLVHGMLPRGRRCTGIEWRTGTIERCTGKIELYDSGRYFTVTGEYVAGMPATIEERTAALAALHLRIFGTNGNGRHEAPRRAAVAVDPDDARLLERAHAARKGWKFAALWKGDVSAYPSQSEADLALCNLLAFWTGGDAARIDRLFRQSGLMRAKWDERRGGQTYGERTIATAIANR